MQTSRQFIRKIADKFRADINIAFTYCNNVAMILQRMPDMIPNDTQAKDLKRCLVRATSHSTRDFEGLCRFFPWCIRIAPAALTRCLRCDALMMSVGRFMDQGCLGTPRTLDSVIRIDVEVETAEFDPVQQNTQEDERSEDELKLVEDQAAGVNVEEIQDDSDQTDQCGEHEDYWNEYLTVSNSKATQSPALCLNIEEISKVCDEMLACFIFQRKDLLNDYVALSFKEMREKMDDHRMPFTSKQVSCPAFIDE